MRLLRLCIFVAGVATAAVSAQAQSFDERQQLCFACHGEKGQSETEGVPSLGGQPALYTVIQLFMFRQKLRTVDPMNDMAAGLSDAELQKFADLIAKQPPPKPASDPMDAAKAQRAEAVIRAQHCAVCHNNLAGNESVPRIGAQREDYLLKSLRDYKSGARREYQPVMAEVMGRVSEDDIVALAHYLSRTAAR